MASKQRQTAGMWPDVTLVYSFGVVSPTLYRSGSFRSFLIRATWSLEQAEISQQLDESMDQQGRPSEEQHQQ